MSLHQTMKNIYRYVARNISGNYLVFHHVPRCGGTSLSRAIRVKYILSQFSLDAPASYATIEGQFKGKSDTDELYRSLYAFREELLLYALNSYYRSISGHIRFSERAYKQFCQLYKFITVIREPVSRFISDYYKNFGKDTYSGTRMPILDYVNTVEGKTQATIYCNYFSGLPPGSDFSTNLSLNKAKENIAKFDSVGFLDDMPRFAQDISELLGVKIRIGHENKSKKPKEKGTSVNSEVREVIEKICANDIKFYNYARQHFL